MLIKEFPDKAEFEIHYKTSNVIPVCREILADMDTPVSMFAKLYENKGPAALLESVEGGERWGRYSFVCASARAQVRIFKDRVEFTTGDEKKQVKHDGDPLSVCREWMKQYTCAEIPGMPRFWGGFVGYISYEMVSFFERIENKLPESEPLAHFFVPEELLIFDNIKNTVTMVAIIFAGDHKSSADAYSSGIRKLDELSKKIQERHAPNHADPHEQLISLSPVIDPERFRQMVSYVKQQIVSGEIIQAVISQPFVCDPPRDILSLYRAQRFINPSPYMFFLHLDDTVLVGSSPETMVRLENGIATLRPIAGTRPRGKTEQEDRALADELLKDEKERAEHLMLVDLGRNDLGRVAETGTVEVTDLMVIERYSHVMHLVSNIRCYLREDHDAWDLLSATFPAGTLSGAPKVRAMEIISLLEETPRGPYGGAVGYISFAGNMDLAITIRTAVRRKGRLVVQAGAGIVYDSDPEKERIETINKAMAIQRALEMISKSPK